MDLIIRNARLRRTEGLKDIGISGGRIAAIESRIQGSGAQEIDAGGRLVTESFVNTHLHLCKVYTLAMMDEMALAAYHGDGMGKAMNAIELAARIKEQYDEEWILPNVRKALRLAACFGCTHIRAFADVDSKAKLVGVKALLKAREEFRGIVDVQVVAFPQDGVAREPGTLGLIRNAMELGADVVGGIPWIEFTEADSLDHVEQMVRIAREFDADVSMLVDDAGDPGLRTLEMLACSLVKEGMVGRGLAHHARAMALYPTPYFQKVSALLKKADMGVVSDPHTGPLHARVRELLAEGNLVCLGQDDISDAYYPYGRNNMLEVAFLNSHLLWMTGREDMEILYDMVTTKAARCMHVKDFGLAVGKTAHLVVLREKNLTEALRHHREPLHVISHGLLLDAKLFAEGDDE
jgi:cytosine deaminase